MHIQRSTLGSSANACLTFSYARSMKLYSPTIIKFCRRDETYTVNKRSLAREIFAVKKLVFAVLKFAKFIIDVLCQGGWSGGGGGDSPPCIDRCMAHGAHRLNTKLAQLILSSAPAYIVCSYQCYQCPLYYMNLPLPVHCSYLLRGDLAYACNWCSPVTTDWA